MGRDLTLYPKRGSKTELKSYLEDLGFSRCQHLWEWPSGTLTYSWFDERDYKSIDGVSADIYPIDGKEAAISGHNIALHVRNLYSASWHDVKMLNDVLRGARKRFGGRIEGDYGTNKYAPLWKDESTPISRGLTAVYQRVAREMNVLRFALPDSVAAQPTIATQSLKADYTRQFFEQLDPARVLYNGLVPFAVAMFEHFFSAAFRVLIGYDEHALRRRASYNLRVDFPTLLDVSRNVRTVEDVITAEYTFQNLDQLNKAYKDWLNIDVRKLLYKKRRIGRSVAFLENRISEIIQYRHGIVHRLELDRSLTKDGYVAILTAIDSCIGEFLIHIERKYSVAISRD